MNDPQVVQQQQAQGRTDVFQELQIGGREIRRHRQPERKEQIRQRPRGKYLPQIMKQPRETFLIRRRGKGRQAVTDPEENPNGGGRDRAENERPARPRGHPAVHQPGQGEGTSQEMKVEDRHAAHHPNARVRKWPPLQPRPMNVISSALNRMAVWDLSNLK